MVVGEASDGHVAGIALPARNCRRCQRGDATCWRRFLNGDLDPLALARAQQYRCYPVHVVLAMAVLAVLVMVTSAVLIHPNWLLLGVLVHLEMAWLLVNDDVEGAVLLALSDEHGLTVADLLIPAMIPILILTIGRLLRRDIEDASAVRPPV
jgi:hypothetical protein